MINGRYYAQATLKLKPATSGRVATFFPVTSIRRQFFDNSSKTYMLARTFPLALRSRRGRGEDLRRNLQKSLGRKNDGWKSGLQQQQLALEHFAWLELALEPGCELEFAPFEPEAALVAFAA